MTKHQQEYYSLTQTNQTTVHILLVLFNYYKIVSKQINILLFAEIDTN